MALLNNGYNIETYKGTISIFSCIASKQNVGTNLFDQLPDTNRFNVADNNPKELYPLLLFGEQNLGTVANRVMLGATFYFVKGSVKFNYS